RVTARESRRQSTSRRSAAASGAPRWASASPAWRPPWLAGRPAWPNFRRGDNGSGGPVARSGERSETAGRGWASEPCRRRGCLAIAALEGAGDQRLQAGRPVGELERPASQGAPGRPLRPNRGGQRQVVRRRRRTVVEIELRPAEGFRRLPVVE